jgi:hypothetical protein
MRENLNLVLTEDEADLLQYYLDYDYRVHGRAVAGNGRDPAGNIRRQLSSGILNCKRGSR